jgi:two-component system chemotaxis response regulator CheY
MNIIRVLILEDDAFQRRFLQLYLESVGFTVEYGGNGQEGMKKLEESIPFDLIMSDMNMPVMNGLEFIVHVKEDERFCHIPIVLLSKVDDVNIREQAHSLGASHFMEKPFTNEKISSVLKNLERVQ